MHLCTKVSCHFARTETTRLHQSSHQPPAVACHLLLLGSGDKTERSSPYKLKLRTRVLLGLARVERRMKHGIAAYCSAFPLSAGKIFEYPNSSFALHDVVYMYEDMPSVLLLYRMFFRTSSSPPRLASPLPLIIAFSQSTPYIDHFTHQLPALSIK